MGGHRVGTKSWVVGEGLGMDAVGTRRKRAMSLILSYGYTYFFFYEWVLL